MCVYLMHTCTCAPMCTSAFISLQIHTIVFNPILIISCSNILSMSLCLTVNYNLRVFMTFPEPLLGIRGRSVWEAWYRPNIEELKLFVISPTNPPSLRTRSPQTREHVIWRIRKLSLTLG